MRTYCSALPVTARSLEALIRLSQAHAKLHLADSVEAVDVAIASRILDRCYSQCLEESAAAGAPAAAVGTRRSGPANWSDDDDADDGGDSNDGNDDDDDDDDDDDGDNRPARRRARKRTLSATAAGADSRSVGRSGAAVAGQDDVDMEAGAPSAKRAATVRATTRCLVLLCCWLTRDDALALLPVPSKTCAPTLTCMETKHTLSHTCIHTRQG